MNKNIRYVFSGMLLFGATNLYCSSSTKIVELDTPGATIDGKGVTTYSIDSQTPKIFLPLRAETHMKFVLSGTPSPTKIYNLYEEDWFVMDALYLRRAGKGSGMILIVNSDKSFDWIQTFLPGDNGDKPISIISVINFSKLPIVIDNVSVAGNTTSSMNFILDKVTGSFLNNRQTQLKYDGRTYHLGDKGWYLVDVFAKVAASSPNVSFKLRDTFLKIRAEIL